MPVWWALSVCSFGRSESIFSYCEMVETVKTSMPKVSVILTSYNHDKFIKYAIESVLNQTYTDYELIIWDDASSDNSWSLINQYSDPRIKTFRNDENTGGIVYESNKAFSDVATGKYIAIHHSDDVWETEKLEKQVAFLDANDDCGAVFTNALAITEDGSPLTDEKHFYFDIFDQPNRTRFEWLNHFFYKGNALCHPSVLIRKKCYEECGLYRLGLAQLPDFDMWIRLCLKYEIHVLPEKLVKFRVRDNEANASGSRPETRIRALYEFYKLLSNYRKVTCFADLVKVFPSAEKYNRKRETDIDFTLAMIALEEKPFPFTALFGLDLLFEIISDPVRAATIKRLYDFDDKSFKALTAQHDVFSREEVDTLWGTLRERDAQIVGLNQSVIECNENITGLNQDVTERDVRIGNLNQTVTELDKQIIFLGASVAEREVQIAKLTQTLTERDGQITSLNQEAIRYNEALKTIEEIRASSSWRATAPMRFISSKINNIARVLKLLPSIVRFGGGILGSVRKALRIFSREGLIGVKRRILFVGGNRSGVISPKIRPDLASAAVDRNDYTEWIRRYDTLTDELRAGMRDRIDAFARKPLISVIMPVYNPKPKWLEEAIESVRKQIYPNWELCIADDASTDKVTRPILERYAKEDPRIKIVFREKNGHISVASNSALGQATGEWIALLDNDDLLPEHALFWVADAINHNPDVRLIYSDEDKINESGKRFNPYFKCDWNVDLFYSQNMISHLGVYRTDLLKKIGGFRERFEGAQDYDLALRFIELIEPKQIHHIPRVLYHWRSHAKSTASSAEARRAKPYALPAGHRALNEHFQRGKINGMVEQLAYGYRARYDLPDSVPLVSLIIPTRNNLHLLQKCIVSILKKTTYSNYEILIIDNGSDDPETLQYLEELQAKPNIRVVRDDRPFNFSALNNTAVKLVRGELVGLLNNDLEVIAPEWLSEMVSHALRPGVGAVGARLWYPNETLQHGGVIIGLGGVAGHAHHHMHRHHYGYFGRAALTNSFSAVSAACLLIRKVVYIEVGGFNENDLPVAFNDVDFCLRVREKGYRNVWTPYAELYHHESASRGKDDTPEKQTRFTKEVQWMKGRWGKKLLNDPAYTPNLTLDHGDFSLAWPPRIELLPTLARSGA